MMLRSLFRKTIFFFARFILVKVDVSVGENVIYGQYDGTEIDYEGSPHTLIRDDDILVKFAGDELTKEVSRLLLC